MNPETLLVSARRLAAALLVSAFLACDGAPKREPAPPTEAQAHANAEAATTAQPLEAGAPGATETEADDTPSTAVEPPPLMPFGVPECDKFVKKYVACVEGRVPADQRARLMEELQQDRAKWRDLARMQQAGVALSLACRTVAQKSKGDLTVDYGCEF